MSVSDALEDLSLVDAAIFASLYDLTIESVRAKLVEENAKFQRVNDKKLEERIISLLHGESKSRIYVPPTIILERGKWKAHEEFALVRLARAFTSEQQIKREIERRRFWFDFQCPTRVIVSSVLAMKDADEANVMEIVRKMAIKFARVERAVMDCSFTDEDLRKACVDPVVFRQWRESLEEAEKQKKSDERRQIEVQANSEVIQALVDSVSSVLQPKTATLASIVLHSGICNVARKNFLVGEDDGCDLNLRKLPEFVPKEEQVKLLLSFKNDLWFYLENLGQCDVLVNGYLIHVGDVVYVPHEAVIKIGSVPMMFRYNLWMIERLKNTMARPAQ